MRTEEQIRNLRFVLANIAGPYVALLASDEMVNAWADSIQKEIDNLSKNTWMIQARLTEEKHLSWEDIDFEPRRIVCSYNTISSKILDFLLKHPEMDSMRIINLDKPQEFVFSVKITNSQ